MGNVQSNTLNADCFEEPILFLAGPTATGKTDTAIQIAQAFDCEIIGVDSMQIYKYMDIGSAKPSLEEMSCVPHHLIDFVEPNEAYNASRFVSDCHEAIGEIRSRQKIPLLVGGTGLYFQALEFGLFAQPEIDEGIRVKLRSEASEYGTKVLFTELMKVDPETSARIHQNDTYRLLRALEIYRSTGRTWSRLIAEHKAKQGRAMPWRKLFKIGLDRQRSDLYERINKRAEIMVDLGLFEEVKKLLDMGFSETLSSMQSLGYRHSLSFLSGEWSLEKTVELLARDTRHYAKRQFTWFKKDTAIRWFFPNQRDLLLNEIDSFLKTP